MTTPLLLVALITLTPRIPLPIEIPGRSFELRPADVALVIALPLWWLTPRLSIWTLPIWKAIAAYLLIGFAATVMGVLLSGLSAVRGAAYFLKEVEYFAIFFVGATTYFTRSARFLPVLALLLAGGANAGWFGVQIVIDRNFSPLAPADYTESYGPHLIGEGSPFSVGCFFMAVFLLAAALLVSAKSSRAPIPFVLVAGSFFTCLMLTETRVTLVGGLAGAGILVTMASGRRRRAAGLLLIAVSLGFAASVLVNARHVSAVAITPPLGSSSAAPAPFEVSVPNPAQAVESGVVGRLSRSALDYSITQRLGIWEPVLVAALERPLTGYGKGAMGGVAELPWSEAHMQFLRVFAESGVIGLATFVALLVAVIRLARRKARDGGHLGQTMGTYGAALTVAMCTAALLQDAFLPVLPNELYWIFIGFLANASVTSDRFALDHDAIDPLNEQDRHE